jgi:hypothetical protein
MSLSTKSHILESLLFEQIKMGLLENKIKTSLGNMGCPFLSAKIIRFSDYGA